MVMSVAGTIAANEATRDRGEGESIVSTAFKFGILIIAVFALVALLLGLWLFNNWAGIIDFGEGILSWGSDLVGGFWGGLTGIVPAIGSFLLPNGRGFASKKSIRGINPSDFT
jgi:hypothetical protein